MQIKIICVGKQKGYALEGESEYVKRLKSYLNLNITELTTPKTSHLPEGERKQRETELILSKVRPSDYLVVLDEKGSAFTSIQFAKLLEKETVRGKSSFIFAIGGAYGFHPSIHERANLTLSLSKLTLPYQLARLMLLEQIYRTITVIRGLPYHK